MNMRQESIHNSGTSGYRKAADLAHEALRRRILTGELESGARIDLDEEASRLSMSRMPIREAVQRLESEGLVEIQPHRAVYVKALTVEDLEDIYILRIALEGTAGKLGTELISDETLVQIRDLLGSMQDIVARQDRRAWLDADERFHDMLYRSAQHPRLLSVIKGLREEAGRYRLISLAQPQEIEDGFKGHQAIVDACAARDGETVERIIVRSLQRSRDRLRALLVTGSPDGDQGAVPTEHVRSAHSTSRVTTEEM